MTPVRRLVLAALATSAVTIGAIAALVLGDGPTRRTTADGAAAPTATVGGPFSLVDTSGRRRTEADFRGKFSLVFFGFTHCPDVCPTAMQGASEALALLGPGADRLTVVFISVDPARDTPAALAAYAENFDRRIVWLTGNEAEVAAAARAYRVYFSRRPAESSASYSVDHSGYLYLMDRNGRFVAHFRHGIAPAELAAALKKHL